MLRSARKHVEALPAVPLTWLASVGSLGGFVWLLLQNQIHPLFIYLLQVYLTF